MTKITSDLTLIGRRWWVKGGRDKLLFENKNIQLT